MIKLREDKLFMLASLAYCSYRVSEPLPSDRWQDLSCLITLVKCS